MPQVEPSDITWELSSDAWKFVHGQTSEFQAHYEDIKAAFKAIVCDYITAVGNCDQKTLGISPLGGLPDGEKLFKIRLPLPGRGKSGGLRVQFAANCAASRVVVLTIDERKEC